MQLIGLTGGIGSGKTTVAHIFEVIGVPVYPSDLRARQLMEKDGALASAIAHQFGSRSYHPDGTLNVAHLADLAFSDPARLRELNALVHPAVASDLESWMTQQAGPYVLMETALLRETMAMTHLFRVIAVMADADLRKERVRFRDGLEPNQVQQRMSRQLSDAELNSLADYIIVNNGTYSLIDQCLAIHNSLLNAIERKGQEC
ncbi:MAG: dephospho-CoA kinase [Saprospiraceae bacterium]|nr:dephospho-CoA kinase [Saprospiraceae bacterium]